MICNALRRRVAFGKANPLFGLSAMGAVLTAFCTAPRPADAQDSLDRPEQQSPADIAPSSCGGMDCAELRAAGQEAMKIVAEAQRINQSRGSYPQEFADKVLSLYTDGLAVGGRPCDPLIVSEFWREFVIGLLWDLFQATAHDESSGFENPLDDESANRFREVLTAVLRTAPANLDFVQRARVYLLAGRVLSPEHTDAVSALESLSLRPDFTRGERELVRFALDEIRTSD